MSPVPLDPGSAAASPPPLHVLDLPASAPLPGDLVLDLGEDRVDVVILRGLLAPEACAAVAEEVEGRRDSLPWVLQDDPSAELSQVALLGCALTPYGAHPDGPPLPYYLDEADRFRALYAQLIAPRLDILPVVADVLSRAAAGRPVAEPTGPDGRLFPPATLRRMPEGCGIPIHVGRWFQTTAGYAPLLPQVRRDFQLSWFVTLQRPDAGGALEVFDLAWGAADTPWFEPGRVDGEAVVATRRRLALDLSVGDLLLFNGGRWYHRVTPVEGPRPRFTFGGFCGLSTDGSRLLRWS